jgi:hypothetical protein
MISYLKRHMLQLLKVPPEPHLPVGAVDSAKMFRASKRYLQLKLLNWGVGQFFTLVGLIGALVVLHLIAEGTLDVLDKVPHRAIILRFAGWIEVIGVVGFLVQLPLSLVPVILDWEMRWYIVTDRSLRRDRSRGCSGSRTSGSGPRAEVAGSIRTNPRARKRAATSATSAGWTMRPKSEI